MDTGHVCIKSKLSNRQIQIEILTNRLIDKKKIIYLYKHFPKQ